MEGSDSDGVSGTSAYLASMLTPSDPENMKLAFAMLIDRLIEKAEGSIIDWGTAQFVSYRYISDVTGQELHAFSMTVHALEVEA
jgi:hypothetical protein